MLLSKGGTWKLDMRNESISFIGLNLSYSCRFTNYVEEFFSTKNRRVFQLCSINYLTWS